MTWLCNPRFLLIYQPNCCTFLLQIHKDNKINKVHQKSQTFRSFSWTVKLKQQGWFGTIEWHRALQLALASTLCWRTLESVLSLYTFKCSLFCCIFTEIVSKYSEFCPILLNHTVISVIIAYSLHLEKLNMLQHGGILRLVFSDGVSGMGFRCFRFLT